MDTIYICLVFTMDIVKGDAIVESLLFLIGVVSQTVPLDRVYPLGSYGPDELHGSH